MKKYLKNRLKNDVADAVIVTTVISLLMLFLAAGFAIDISKNSMLRNTYYNMAQDSVETSVKTINASGSLNYSTIERVYSAYMVQKNSNETKVYESEQCSQQYDENGDPTGILYPYMNVSLDRERGQESSSKVEFHVNSEGEITLTSGEIDDDIVYRVVSAEIYDSAPNLMLNSFGMNCQEFKSSVSAIVFGVNEDL